MIFKKAGKLSFKLAILLLSVIVIASFFDLKKVQAVEPVKIVINEVQYDPPQAGTDSSYEWFELLNAGENDVTLDGWKIADNNSQDELPYFELKSGDFLVVAASEVGYLENFPDLPNNFIDLGGNIGGGLSNTGDRLVLTNSSDEVMDQVSWGTDLLLDPSVEDVNSGHSIERSPKGLDTDLATDFIDQENPTPGMGIPEKVLLDAPSLNDNKVILSWTDPEPDDLFNYEIYVSEISGELGDYLDETLLGDFEVEGLQMGKTYYFTVRKYNSDGIYNDSEQGSIFLPIVYSKDIIINEICPHPKATDNEFIELYNTGSTEIDLSGWYLDDIDGGSKPYEIPQNTIIGPKKFLAFYRSETGIALNDTGDWARLLYPDGELAYKVNYIVYAALDMSFSRKDNGQWAWTTTPTFAKANIFTSTKVVEEEKSEPINTVPFEIKTGEYQDYLDKLVKVVGKVTSTSGNTFYLDDGSGVAKIYIQEKTGIDKPEMHKNDIFEITGIVDLYGKTWRILPQNQDDIKLIEAAPKVVKSSSTKSTTKKSTTEKSDANVDPKTSLNKEVAAATTEKENNSQNNKSSFWIQALKALLAIAVIFFIVFILKILRRPKPKTIGGHFGDDET